MIRKFKCGPTWQPPKWSGFCYVDSRDVSRYWADNGSINTALKFRSTQEATSEQRLQHLLNTGKWEEVFDEVHPDFRVSEGL